MICYHASLYDAIVSATSDKPTSLARSSAIFVLSIIRNKKYDFKADLNGTLSITNFIQMRPAVLESNHADRQAYG